MVFNVLANVKSLTTRCYAVDLVQDLVFELLLSLCTVDSLRTCICRLLFSVSVPPADQLSQLLNSLPGPECPPLVAALCWGLQPVGTSSTTSLVALDFLREMYEELLCGEENDLRSGCVLFLPALIHILKEPWSIDMPRLKTSCARLSRTLKLITVLCSEDEIKAAVAELVKTEYFMGQLDFQMAYNRLLLNQSLAHKFDANLMEDWGCGDSFANPTADVQDTALCTESRYLLPVSPSVAAANARKAGSSIQAQSTEAQKQLMLSNNKENMPLLRNTSTGDMSLQSICTDVDTSIQSLIEKMHSSIELKDMKTADVIDIYEHRLQSHQMKEDHLQDLLEAKSLALTQADRLIAQYRSRQARHGAEAHKMRCLFQEAERKNDSLLKEMNELKLDKDRLKSDIDMLRHEKNQLELQAQELCELKVTHTELKERYSELEFHLTKVQQELKTTQEMHEILQKHYESLKHQHDVTSEQLKKLEEESKLMSRELKDKAAKLQETTKALQTLNEKHSQILKDKEEVEQEKEELEKATDTLRGNIAILEQTKRELLQKVKSLEHITQEQEIVAKAYQDKLQHLEAEVSQHAEVAALINKLTSGRSASAAPPKM
ncbi:hypothetical protein C0Q70_11186 [Pomacea canaliculata]|uniref:CIP2A N-terminal domain-containing protein n=1 Tax=Pomacea canaliculata TaxID=400727 RepID=A0A2T7P5C2_POMCA|nr:hypothetical protein C0Q70_11186 [Pomacea canaliculata]